MKKQLLNFFLLLLSFQGFPQWTNYDASNTKALDASLVSDIILSGSNIIWFATNQGLIKYDKSNTTWTRFTNLPNNFVYDIQIDNNQNIWAATNGGGVIKHNGQTFQTYNTDNGLAHNIVRAITKDLQGNLWFATYGGGISRFNGISWLNYGLNEGLPTKYFYSAFCDSQGNLWFGTSGQGVLKYNGISWQSYKTINGLVSNTIIKIYEDSSHRLWFCGQGGVSIFNGNNFQNLTQANGLSDDLVYCVMENNNGTFNIGTENGLNIWDGSQISVIDTTDGMADNTVLCMIQDQTGKNWYGHTQKGASCYDGNQWIYYGDANGLQSNYIYKAVCGQNGKMWFISNYGITQYDGFTWKTFSPVQNNYYNLISMDIDQQGNIWTSSYNQVYLFNGTSWQLISIPITGNYISNLKIYTDKSWNIWISYYSYTNGIYTYGVLKYSNGNWTNYDSSNSPISSYVNAIFVDSYNNLWVATSNGLHRKSNTIWTTFNSSAGLANNNVTCIAQYQNGNMWFGCNNYSLGGISTYDGANWTTYRSQLHTLYINCIFFDSGGKLWISGDRQNYNNSCVFSKYKNGIWEYQNSTSGLPLSYSYKYITEDQIGNIWACSTNGISTGNLTLVPADNIQSDPLELTSNYPNPFFSETKIRFELNKAGTISIEIYNINGKNVRNYYQKNMSAGENEITIQRDNLPSGIYFYRISDGYQIFSNKMTIQ